MPTGSHLAICGSSKNITLLGNVIVKVTGGWVCSCDFEGDSASLVSSFAEAARDVGFGANASDGYSTSDIGSSMTCDI